MQALTDFMVENGAETQYIVVHGDAMGADTMADWSARCLKGAGWDVEVEVHPANWDALGTAAGVIRNQMMVDLGADVCLAFSHRNSRGTLHCSTIAEAAGIPVRLHTRS